MILVGRLLVVLLLAWLPAGGAARAATGVRISRAAHLGWTNAWTLGNGTVEVDTDPDPVPYVELETLGPQRRLSPGGELEVTNTYTLFRRFLADEEAEARRILASGGAAPR